MESLYTFIILFLLDVTSLLHCTQCKLLREEESNMMPLSIGLAIAEDYISYQFKVGVIFYLAEVL